MIKNYFSDPLCTYGRTMGIQWRAEEGRTPRASKASGHPKSEITKN